MAIAKLYTTSASKLNSLPVQDGNLIFVKDTKKIYLDSNGNRIGYTDITVFETESERSSVLAPVEGFYFVEDTHMLWRYRAGWIQLSPSNLEPIYFGVSESDLPTVGDPKVLYTTNDGIYKWDSVTKSYCVISSKLVWESLV